MAAEAAVEAIDEAVEEGDTETVARMLDEDPRLLTTFVGVYPLLTRAASAGHVGIVELLLERGADVNAPDEDEFTALHSAALQGHEEVVSALLTSGADPTRMDDSGSTALMWASDLGHVAVVRLLCMGECGLDERDGFGRTALWSASIKGHTDIVRALLLAGADHTIADNRGATPQQVAQSRGHFDCTDLIQWWEGELARVYVLHKARMLHDDTTTRQQAPAAPVPAYLRRRVQQSKPGPRVQVQGRGSGGPRTRGAAKRGAEEGGQKKEEEEEVCGMVNFVVKDLDGHLYTELLAGLLQ